MNVSTGNTGNRPSSNSSRGLKTPLLHHPSFSYSSLTAQLHTRLPREGQPNLLALPADGVISNRGDCTLCQQPEHMSSWLRPPEIPPVQKPMQICWIWAVVLLQDSPDLPFSTREPELWMNTSLWAWGAQCHAGLQGCVMGWPCCIFSEAFFPELFDCVWISEIKLRIPCWQRETPRLVDFLVQLIVDVFRNNPAVFLLTGELHLLVLILEDDLSDKGHLQTDCTEGRGELLYTEIRLNFMAV